MDYEPSILERFIATVVALILLVTTFSGTMYVKNKPEKSEFVESSEFSIVGKHTEVADKVSTQKYIIEFENADYGKVEINNFDLYNKAEIGSNMVIEVYERTNGSYKFIW